MDLPPGCCWPAADGLLPPPQAVRPENVVVELCKSRVAAMGDGRQPPPPQQQQQQGQGGGKWSNPLNLSGGGFVEVAARSLKLGGQSGMLLRLLLAGQAERAASEWRAGPWPPLAAAAAASALLGAACQGALRCQTLRQVLSECARCRRRPPLPPQSSWASRPAGSSARRGWPRRRSRPRCAAPPGQQQQQQQQQQQHPCRHPPPPPPPQPPPQQQHPCRHPQGQAGCLPRPPAPAPTSLTPPPPAPHTPQLVLGDRPVEITLERAWEALSWRRRLELCAALVAPGLGGPAAGAAQPALTRELLESFKCDDALSSFARQLGERYPELLGPLVHERDLYLAWSLKRSKAVNGTQRVVGVVGRGHLRGIVHALHTDSGALRFADLVGGRNTREYKRQQRLRAAGRLALEAALGLGLYEAWAQAQAAAGQ
jgi:hypothetical protein